MYMHWGAFTDNTDNAKTSNIFRDRCVWLQYIEYMSTGCSLFDVCHKKRWARIKNIDTILLLFPRRRKKKTEKINKPWESKDIKPNLSVETAMYLKLLDELAYIRVYLFDNDHDRSSAVHFYIYLFRRN